MNVIQPTKDTIRKIVKGTIAYIEQMPKRTAIGINGLLDSIYEYHGPATPPGGVSGKLWLAIPGISSSTPDDYIFKQYYVNQQPADWPSPNECVTAATIQIMNMMQDILAAKFDIPTIPHSDLASFAAIFDSHGLWNWLTRPPANVPIMGGMLPPQNAKRVLKAHSKSLRANSGCGYRVELTSGNTVDDLIENLKNGYPTSLHISQDVKLFKIENEKVKYGDWRAPIGDAPHTVTLAGYDGTTDTWLILDPAPRATTYTTWKTGQLMDLWGRRFIGYPPRFAMTTLIPDIACTLPTSPPT